MKLQDKSGVYIQLSISDWAELTYVYSAVKQRRASQGEQPTSA